MSAATWRRTWPDCPHDFSASDGDLPIGRVFRIEGGPVDGKWRWTMTASLGNRLGNSGGTADSRDHACHAVETAYVAFRAKSD